MFGSFLAELAAAPHGFLDPLALAFVFRRGGGGLAELLDALGETAGEVGPRLGVEFQGFGVELFESRHPASLVILAAYRLIVAQTPMPNAFMTSWTERAARMIPMTRTRIDAPCCPMIRRIGSDRRSMT